MSFTSEEQGNDALQLLAIIADNEKRKSAKADKKTVPVIKASKTTKDPVSLDQGDLSTLFNTSHKTLI